MYFYSFATNISSVKDQMNKMMLDSWLEFSQGSRYSHGTIQHGRREDNCHNPIKITMIFLNFILGNDDTFQDDGSKNPLNVRIF